MVKESHWGKHFELKRLFIPINLGQKHWALVVIHFRNKLIQYYDSMRGDAKNKEHAVTKCKGVLNYLKDEHETQYEGRKMYTSFWTIDPRPKRVPQQSDGE